MSSSPTSSFNSGSSGSSEAGGHAADVAPSGDAGVPVANDGATEPAVSPEPGANQNASAAAPDPNLRELVEQFGDIGLVLSCVLGRTRMHLRDLLALKTESIVRVDGIADEDLELVINGVSIGLADINVVGNQVLLLVTDRNNAQ